MWQDVTNLRYERHSYIHTNITQSELFPEIEKADASIRIVRMAIKSLYSNISQEYPSWIDEDEDRGWDNGSGTVAHATLLRAGAKIDDPNVIKITYILQGTEHISDVCPPDADYENLMNELVKNIRAPISSVRAYRGETLIKELPFSIR